MTARHNGGGKSEDITNWLMKPTAERIGVWKH